MYRKQAQKLSTSPGNKSQNSVHRTFANVPKNPFFRTKWYHGTISLLHFSPVFAGQKRKKTRYLPMYRKRKKSAQNGIENDESVTKKKTRYIENVRKKKMYHGTARCTENHPRYIESRVITKLGTYQCRDSCLDTPQRYGNKKKNILMFWYPQR